MAMNFRGCEIKTKIWGFGTPKSVDKLRWRTGDELNGAGQDNTCRVELATCVVGVGQSEAGGSSGVAEELATTHVTLNGQRCGRLWAVKAKSKVAVVVMSQEQDEKVCRPHKVGSRVCKAGSGLLSQGPSECWTALNQWRYYSAE
ncbi:unnamed protein product [Camellia sinensis]